MAFACGSAERTRGFSSRQQITQRDYFLLALFVVKLWTSNPHSLSAAEVQARQGKRALPMGSLLGVNDPRQAEFDAVLRRIYAAEMVDPAGIEPTIAP